MKRKLSRITALIVVLAMFVVLLPSTVAASPFRDVEHGHYAFDAIVRWTGYGVLRGRGDGTFDPTASATRAEFATMLTRIMGYSVAAPAGSFTDIAGHWAAGNYILPATAAGAFVPGGTFRPDDPITRIEAFAALSRALGLDISNQAPTHFTDDALLTPELRGVANAITAAGVVQGMGDGRFGVHEPIQRAHIMLIFHRSISAFVQSSTTLPAGLSGFVVVRTPGVTITGTGAVNANLIIAQGVGDGVVTLQDVNLLGSLLVRAGGSDSVHIVGTSIIRNVVVERGGAEVAIRVGEGASVNSISVSSGEVVVSGVGDYVPTVARIEVESGATVIIDASVIVAGLEIVGDDVTVIIYGTVEELAIIGDGVVLEVAEGAVIEVLVVEGEGLEVDNQGEVQALYVDADVLGSLEWEGYDADVETITIDGEAQPEPGLETPVQLPPTPPVAQPPAGDTVAPTPQWRPLTAFIYDSEYIGDLTFFIVELQGTHANRRLGTNTGQVRIMHGGVSLITDISDTVVINGQRQIRFVLEGSISIRDIVIEYLR